MASDQSPARSVCRQAVDENGAASADAVERDLSEPVGTAAIFGVPRRTNVAQEVDEVGSVCAQRDPVSASEPPSPVVLKSQIPSRRLTGARGTC